MLHGHHLMSSLVDATRMSGILPLMEVFLLISLWWCSSVFIDDLYVVLVFFTFRYKGFPLWNVVGRRMH